MSTTLQLVSAAKRRQMIGLVALSLGYFMVLLDSTILNVALPAIEEQLHSSLQSVQWVSNSYTLVFASFLLTAGTLSDRYGARRIFCLGLLIFTLSSLFCSLALNVELLIVARILQGLGAALLVPGSLSLIAHLFVEPQEQARAVAIWAGIASLAVAGGPFLGGLLVGALGWRSVFLVNIPCGIVALLLTFTSLTATPQQKNRSLDLLGQTLAVLACCTLTYGCIEWGHVPSSWIIAAFVVTILAGAAFIVVEKRNAHPMLPLQLFRSWRVSAIMLVALLYQFSFYSVIFVFSLFFQIYDKYTALQAGLAFAPQTVFGSLLLLIGAKRIASRIRPVLSLAVGMTLGCIGMLVMLLGVRTNFVVLACGEALIGALVVFVVPPLITVVLASVEKEYSGIASASLNTARQMGGVLGVAILGTVLGSQSLFEGTQWTLLIMAGAFLLGLVLILSTYAHPFRSPNNATRP